MSANPEVSGERRLPKSSRLSLLPFWEETKEEIDISKIRIDKAQLRTDLVSRIHKRFVRI